MVMRGHGVDVWKQNMQGTPVSGAFPHGSVGKESASNAGDTGAMGSVPGLGRSPEGGNMNPLQYSHLKNSVDRGAWRATVHRVEKSRT